MRGREVGVVNPKHASPQNRIGFQVHGWLRKPPMPEVGYHPQTRKIADSTHSEICQMMSYNFKNSGSLLLVSSDVSELVGPSYRLLILRGSDLQVGITGVRAKTMPMEGNNSLFPSTRKENR